MRPACHRGWRRGSRSRCAWTSFPPEPPAFRPGGASSFCMEAAHLSPVTPHRSGGSRPFPEGTGPSGLPGLRGGGSRPHEGLGSPVAPAARCWGHRVPRVLGEHVLTPQSAPSAARSHSAGGITPHLPTEPSGLTSPPPPVSRATCRRSPRSSCVCPRGAACCPRSRPCAPSCG